MSGQNNGQKSPASVQTSTTSGQASTTSGRRVLRVAKQAKPQYKIEYYIDYLPLHLNFTMHSVDKKF